MKKSRSFPCPRVPPDHCACQNDDGTCAAVSLAVRSANLCPLVKEERFAWKLLRKKSYASPFAKRHGGTTVRYPIGKLVRPPLGVFFSGHSKSDLNIISGGPDDPATLSLCTVQLVGGFHVFQDERGGGLGGVGVVVEGIINLGPACEEDMAWFALQCDAPSSFSDDSVLSQSCILRISSLMMLKQIATEAKSVHVCRFALEHLMKEPVHARLSEHRL